MSVSVYFYQIHTQFMNTTNYGYIDDVTQLSLHSCDKTWSHEKINISEPLNFISIVSLIQTNLTMLLL
jgi:hypothetical protein